MSGASSNQPTALAVCALELHTDGDDIQLTPVGEFRSIDGRPENAPAWRIDSASALQVISSFTSRRRKHVIDYDHQTLHAKKNGMKAPAAGFFDKLEWREGKGLYAVDVDWNEKARAHIAAGEYRYISPVIGYEEKTGRVLDVWMAALTNFPAIDGMDEVLAAAAALLTQSTEENEPVKPTQLAVALAAVLGLAEGASDEDINQAVVALKATADDAKDSGEKIATLTADLEEANNKLATAGGEPDPSKFVSVDVMTDLQTQVADLTAKLNSNEVDDLIIVALSEGKLLPKQKDWARNLGKKDVAELKAYLETAQPVAALAGTQTGGKQPTDEDGNVALTDQQLAVCKSMNIDPEDYKKELAKAS